MSEPESEELVARVYGQALETRADGGRLDEAQQVVYEVEMLTQEVNSGASFEQYCRWASVEEMGGVVARLEMLGLTEAADLTRRALAVAFPKGIPESDAAKDELTDWSADQEEQLAALADAFTEHNGPITNALAAFYRKRGAS